ncbi:hypothetical protein KP79_PYT25194 [Mizuhopecten yessoensis]|uniref:Uncharacterized protein n=1 Tax=Mizuhopecten yessoensis TaxID=6573 RepID=A0A210PS24_MIZYE|nr:hypothetical protein KP79_PYT25194 [Mizuhopecten yessoensis]
MYYKTKLACHNFTMYDLTTHNVVCYFWHEGEGELGANSFASCVCAYILNELGDTDHVTIYSDGCTYQNRNVTLANALLHVSVTSNKTILQKILEKGHTQMECDSIHSTIERSLRDKAIYSPSNYVEAIESARQVNPYKVKYLDHSFFVNYSEVQYYSSIRPGVRVGDPCVTHIRVLKYTPDGKIEYKLMYDEEFQELPRRSRRQEPRVVTSQLYSCPVNIKKSKYKHLQELKKVMPKDYHGLYDALPHSD